MRLRTSMVALCLALGGCSPSVSSGVALSSTTGAAYVVGVQNGKAAAWECPARPSQASCRRLRVVYR